ncbi:MAG TPA: MFS transporter [Negativicutes bacterium]
MANQAESGNLKSKVQIMIPILLFVVFQAAFQAFSPVLAQMKVVFPGASTTLIQMIITIPSLMSIPVALLSGFCATYFTKKRIVQFALSVMFIGGMVPLLIHADIEAVLASSALIGIGQGFLISISTALISEYFDGNERGTTLGFKQVASNLGIAALTIAIGYLATSAWYNAYYVYILVIPILILVSIFLPNGKLDDKIIGKGVGTQGIKNVFTPAGIYMFLLMFFMGATLFTFYTNIAMMITEKGLGDASIVGRVSSVNSIITLIVGFVFGFLLKLFKKYTLTTALLILSVAFFTLSFSTSLSVITLACALIGLGAGIQQISSVYYLTESVPKTAITMAISIAMALISVGVTASPIMVNTIKRVAFNSETASASLLVAGSAYAIMFIVEIIREMTFNKNSTIGIPLSQDTTKNA